MGLFFFGPWINSANNTCTLHGVITTPRGRLQNYSVYILYSNCRQESASFEKLKID